MSKQLIQNYYRELEKTISYGGSRKETVIRTKFYSLLNSYCEQKDLMLITELDYRTRAGKLVYIDGIVKDAFRQDWGYWESKDESDDLDEEIAKKFAKGYPDENILFEDSQSAILIQKGEEIMRIDMKDPKKLHQILTEFVGYERAEISEFRKAIKVFSEELPNILVVLRKLLENEAKTNEKFVKSRDNFLKILQESVNPKIKTGDVREMIIQHILTEEIFSSIFDETQFHRENNIAKSLQEVVSTFFTRNVRRKTVDKINHFYVAIKNAASGIYDHNEKQKFLKVLYESFYKAYSPKNADKLGIVYTPNEIVRFMVKSTDFLLEKHFGKLLSDENVEILDPATGTGTFITDIIDYLPKHDLRRKYENEIHCNEIAILPYYIANLNIEASYHQKMGEYREFENIVLVDTLDNLSFDKSYVGAKEQELFGDYFSSENSERIKKQNERKISVIIGNPPYNANQQNENDNNKNRAYPGIDQRIKDTYIKNSTAQKTKVYDMYSRFIRWASDRVSENGIVAFITNNSFVDSRTFDGFRKSVSQEFDFAYFVDLGGDVRKDPKLSGTKNNVFGIQTGVSIMLLVKSEKAENKNCQIWYVHPTDIRATRDEKLQYLHSHDFSEIPFQHVRPDKRNNWINLTDNDFDDLLPIASKQTKSAKSDVEIDAIFRNFSLGVVTARDEWVYDFDQKNLEKKVRFFVDEYNKKLSEWQKEKSKERVAQDNNVSEDSKKAGINNFVHKNAKIKFTRDLKKQFSRNEKLKFDKRLIRESIYRPFTKKFIYFDQRLNEMQYQLPSIFPEKGNENFVISFSGLSHNKPFSVMVFDQVFGHDTLEKTQSLSFYTYTENGEKIENITDFGLEKFREFCKSKNTHPTSLQGVEIQKIDIFHYIYAVLHNPRYRKKYEQNLKRKFPRIPFYDDFEKWRSWGEKLMNLHLDFETAEKFKFEVVKVGEKKNPKTILKTENDGEKFEIKIDENTTLKNIPVKALDYKLGNRSAVAWILDQYKEKKIRDETIREKFGDYKFSDYKKEVLDLLARVVTVSLRTVEILEEME